MGKTRGYSVLLLEDEVATRKHLAKIVDGHPYLTLFGEASSCTEAYQLLQHEAPDVLLADIGLPDGSGVEIIRKTRVQYPSMESMVLTVFEDEQSVVEALEAGATGYILKDNAFDHLAESIVALMRGESVISPKVARFLLKRFSTVSETGLENTTASTGPSNSCLTRRESEVLTLIGRGYSYFEAGKSLKLSTNTIRSHIRKIYRKLAVKSRTEAVFEATKLGIIDL